VREGTRLGRCLDWRVCVHVCVCVQGSGVCVRYRVVCVYVGVCAIHRAQKLSMRVFR